MLATVTQITTFCNCGQQKSNSTLQSHTGYFGQLEFDAAVGMDSDGLMKIR